MKTSIMPRTNDQTKCACLCGKTQFRIGAQPFARFYCHCAICQSLYAKPYADVSALWARALSPAAPSDVKTARYRRPPALDRSTCAHCGKPVYGVFMLGPLRTIAFVPSANIGIDFALPAPASHIFYHRRIADIDDGLPKYSGYWRSELAVSALLVRRAFAA
jgi:hypothetical protein